MPKDDDKTAAQAERKSERKVDQLEHRADKAEEAADRASEKGAAREESFNAKALELREQAAAEAAAKDGVTKDLSGEPPAEA